MERRDFIKRSSIGSTLAFANLTLAGAGTVVGQNALAAGIEPNMIGAYGPWAASLVGDKPARLSFLRPEFTDVKAWRDQARARLLDCLLQPDKVELTDVRVESVAAEAGLIAERISWQLPYGQHTAALLLKPAGVTGRLPAVLGLHDHGGNKYFGHEKITRLPSDQHPLMRRHQEHYYGGAAWANALARRGYIVLVHDTYAFGSRRVLMSEVHEAARKRVDPVDDDSEQAIEIYNRFAGEHEHLMAKSLFCAGTTWPGVFTSEDQRAVDYLCSRDDVDVNRVGCAGLSGGGLRTAYLAGIDDRIRCACCVGMMTTWRDYLLHKCHTHTWMIYIPGIPRDLDYPEILGLRAPLATMVLNNNEDSLFTLPEMQRADSMLKDIYRKAGAEDRYRCSYYPGPHKFDLTMQADAFAWFDRWLNS